MLTYYDVGEGDLAEWRKWLNGHFQVTNSLRAQHISSM